MHSYIIIHHTYEFFHVALFVNNSLVETITDDKRLASRILVLCIDDLLTKNNIMFESLSFIGVNQGPGLFSTLRSIITTANGLHCAQKIPLIGVDALDATAQEFFNEQTSLTIVLLDAFNADIYYAVADHGSVIKKGYQKIDQFLQALKTEYPSHSFYFVGNGTAIYKNIIFEYCKKQAIIPDDIPLVCSLHVIAKNAFDLFCEGKGGGYLVPLHLKKHPVEL